MLKGILSFWAVGDSVNQITKSKEQLSNFGESVIELDHSQYAGYFQFVLYNNIKGISAFNVHKLMADKGTRSG